MELTSKGYCIGGQQVEKIAEEFGLPLYLYDAQKIVGQYNRLLKSFPNTNIKIKYAAKSLTNLSILSLLKNEGAGLDVVSIEEAKLGLIAGFKPEDILFTPNCVAFEEVEEGVKLGITLNIDNISILEHFGDKYGNTVPCCIRINPHISAGGHSKIQVGHIDSKFGISIFQLPHIKRVVKANDIKVRGLHMHSGSDILDSEVFIRAAQVLFDVAREFQDLEVIDLGSGFKVAYQENDVTTNVEDLGKKLGKVFEAFCKEYGKELELWFEPGKFITSEAGCLLVKTNVIKQTPSAVFVGVDSGMNHLLRPMMYDAYHDIVNISNPKGTQRIYTVVGYICETDTFGWDRKLNEVREGDILAIKNAGSYGFSMSSNYNSRLKPAEVLVVNNQAKLIRKRETIEDLTRNQINIF